MDLLISRGGAANFEKEYKHFYCKADEPTYIKFCKLNILAYIVNDMNIGDLINEIGEYVTDVDPELQKKSVEALGQIALKSEEFGK